MFYNLDTCLTYEKDYGWTIGADNYAEFECILCFCSFDYNEIDRSLCGMPSLLYFCKEEDVYKSL